MNQKQILDLYSQECLQYKTNKKKIINFQDQNTIEIILENNKYNSLSLIDFEIACKIIKACERQDQILMNLIIIGLKIKEKGLQELSELLTEGININRLSLINIGLEENKSLSNFLTNNQLIKKERLQSLNLSGNNIQNEFESIIQTIQENYKGLKHLEVNYCNINDENINNYEEVCENDSLVSVQLEGNQFKKKSINKFLQKKKEIVFVNLCNNVLGSKVLMNLELNKIQSLELSNCRIKNLKLEGLQLQELKYLGLNQNRIGSDGAFRLVQIIKEQNIQLDVIKLDNNKIGNTFIFNLNHFYQTTQDPFFIKQISLKDNLLDDQAYSIVKTNFKIKVDLDNNYIQELNQKKIIDIISLDQIEYYFDHLKQISDNIKELLKAYKGNKLGLLQQALKDHKNNKQNIEQLWEINIKDELLEEEDLKFVSSLIAQVKTIYRLNMESVKIQDDHLVKFLDDLANCDYLVTINFKKKSIQQNQLKFIVQFLKMRNNRVDLNLENNDLENKELLQLVNYVNESQINNKLISFKLANNKITDIHSICNLMKNNHIFRIQDIVLDNNTSVDTKQLMILADSLQDNSLIRISLKNMNIDDLLFDKIIDKIQQTTVQFLHLDSNLITNIDKLINIFRNTQLQIVTVRKNKMNIENNINKLIKNKLIKNVVIDDKQQQLYNNMNVKQSTNKSEREQVDRMIYENGLQMEELFQKRQQLIKRQMDLIKEQDISENRVDDNNLSNEQENLNYLMNHMQQVQGILNMESIEMLQVKVENQNGIIEQLINEQGLVQKTILESEEQLRLVVEEQQQLFKKIEFNETQIRMLMSKEDDMQAQKDAEVFNKQKNKLILILKEKTKIQQDINQALLSQINNCTAISQKLQHMCQQRLKIQLQKHQQSHLNVDLINSISNHYSHLETISNTLAHYSQDSLNVIQSIQDLKAQAQSTFHALKAIFLQQQQAITTFNEKQLLLKNAQELESSSRRILRLPQQDNFDYSAKIHDLKEKQQFLNNNQKYCDSIQAQMVKLDQDLLVLKEKYIRISEYEQNKIQLMEQLKEQRQMKQQEQELQEQIVKLDKDIKKKTKQQMQIQNDIDNSKQDADLDTFQKLCYVLKINKQTIEEAQNNRTQLLTQLTSLQQNLQNNISHMKQKHSHILDFVFINDWKNKILDKKAVEGQNGLFEINRILSIISARLGVYKTNIHH